MGTYLLGNMRNMSIYGLRPSGNMRNMSIYRHRPSWKYAEFVHMWAQTFLEICKICPYMGTDLLGNMRNLSIYRHKPSLKFAEYFQLHYQNYVSFTFARESVGTEKHFAILRRLFELLCFLQRVMNIKILFPTKTFLSIGFSLWSFAHGF